MHTFDLTLDRLTKLEGSASLEVRVKNNKVEHVHFKITEFKRFFTKAMEGKPIIALPATGKSGTVSRICTEIAAGAGVVTTRGHVHWIVTEFGAVNLHGKSLRERGELLISITHPDFRAELTKDLRRLRN